MNAADYLIVGVMFVSMVLGMLRGFVREAIGLLAWLGGLWLAWRYAPDLEPFLGGMVGERPVSLWTARVLLLFAVLLVGWLIAGILGYFLRHSALSVLVDRILGLVFGLVRGAVVIAVFVMLAEFVELNRVEWWKRSNLLPYASEIASWIQNFAETGMKTVGDAQSTRSGA
ncbi:MAG TPA: CvpA family protein [Steroidobacteraceae bacterium]|nr:CvpA family protein [Steroidobacteraceae bacterium]